MDQGSASTGAADVFYDLVSIQYHALKAAQLYDKFLEDARGHEDVEAFIRQCKEQDRQRALDAHRLLGTLSTPDQMSGG